MASRAEARVSGLRGCTTIPERLPPRSQGPRTCRNRTRARTAHTASTPPPTCSSTMVTCSSSFPACQCSTPMDSQPRTLRPLSPHTTTSPPEVTVTLAPRCRAPRTCASMVCLKLACSSTVCPEQTAQHRHHHRRRIQYRAKATVMSGAPGRNLSLLVNVTKRQPKSSHWKHALRI